MKMMTTSGKFGLGSLETRDIQVGDKFLCIRDVRMIDDGELVYKKGEYYESERNNCITDLKGRIEHYWEDTNWTAFFKRWKGHKKKHMYRKRFTLEESWFSESREENCIKPETWKTALEFEKVWLKNYEVDPDWWNVTPYGSIVLDLEVEDGLLSIEFGGTQIGFYTDFEGDLENHASEGFDWTDNGYLLSETLKTLLKNYENNKKS